jgi:hypothetical protein
MDCVGFDLTLRLTGFDLSKADFKLALSKSFLAKYIDLEASSLTPVCIASGALGACNVERPVSVILPLNRDKGNTLNLPLPSNHTSGMNSQGATSDSTSNKRTKQRKGKGGNEGDADAAQPKNVRTDRPGGKGQQQRLEGGKGKRGGSSDSPRVVDPKTTSNLTPSAVAELDSSTGSSQDIETKSNVSSTHSTSKSTDNADKCACPFQFTGSGASLCYAFKEKMGLKPRSRVYLEKNFKLSKPFTETDFEHFQAWSHSTGETFIVLASAEIAPEPKFDQSSKAPP